MSIPNFASEQRLPPITPIDSPAVDRGVRCDDSSPLSRHLGVIPEMLSTLDTLTIAGQHHIMSKVVSFLEDQAGPGARGLSLRNQGAFAELLRHLTSESERLLPDVHAFTRRAEGLVALLGAIA